MAITTADAVLVVPSFLVSRFDLSVMGHSCGLSQGVFGVVGLMGAGDVVHSRVQGDAVEVEDELGQTGLSVNSVDFHVVGQKIP